MVAEPVTLRGELKTACHAQRRAEGYKYKQTYLMSKHEIVFLVANKHTIDKNEQEVDEWPKEPPVDKVLSSNCGRRVS